MHERGCDTLIFIEASKYFRRFIKFTYYKLTVEKYCDILYIILKENTKRKIKMKKTNKIVAIALVLCIAAALVSCGNDTTDAPKGMTKVESEFIDYNLYVPDTWTIDTTSGFASAYVPTDKSSVSLLTMTGTRAYSSIDDYVEEYKNELSSTFANVEFIDEESIIGGISFGGIDAARIVYKISVGESTYKYLQMVTASGIYVYTLTYTALEENFDAHTEDVAKIIDNFSF